MKDKALSDGYVKLYRSLLYHPIFKIREALQLFIYCLLKANHEPGVVIFGRQQIPVDRGQFIFGLDRASSDLSMSVWKVRSSLDLLISLEILTRKTTSKYSIITICNYNYYQDSQNKKPQATQQTSHKQTTTNNKYKNEKNENNKCNNFERLNAFLSSSPEYQSFPLKVNELTLEFINKVRESNKTKTIQGERVCQLLVWLKDILNRTDEDSLLMGLKASFRKMERDGFDFKKRNPTGYVASVAKAQKTQKDQRDLLGPVLEEKEALRTVPEGEVFQKLTSELVN